MPYNSANQLPDSVKNVLPKHAQDIYRAAFNNAYEEYDREESAHRVAWNAVKKKYEKNEETGKWHEK